MKTQKSINNQNQYEYDENNFNFEDEQLGHDLYDYDIESLIKSDLNQLPNLNNNETDSEDDFDYDEDEYDEY